MLARYFPSTTAYRLALLLDALRWPEQNIPRTSNPLDFAALMARRPTTR